MVRKDSVGAGSHPEEKSGIRVTDPTPKKNLVSNVSHSRLNSAGVGQFGEFFACQSGETGKVDKVANLFWGCQSGESFLGVSKWRNS